MRPPTHPGTQIILAPRLPPPPTVVASSGQPTMNGGAPPPLVSPPGEAAAGLVYNPYSAISQAMGSSMGTTMTSAIDPYGFGTAAAPSIIEYPAHLDHAQAGMLVRRDFVTGM